VPIRNELQARGDVQWLHAMPPVTSIDYDKTPLPIAPQLTRMKGVKREKRQGPARCGRVLGATSGRQPRVPLTVR
jgi:hypothetical protein